MTGKSKIGKLSLKNGFKWTIEWTIGDIFSYIEEHGEYYSPSFTVSGSHWYLVVYPNGNNSVGWISVFLRPEKDQQFPISTNFTLGLRKADDSVKEILIDRSHWFKNVIGAGQQQFLERSELLKKSSEFAPSDALTIICYLRVKYKLDDTSRLIELSENFEDLLVSKKFSDVILKVRQEEFPAHKNILATRSSVFAAMLDADMKEKNTGIVDIVDCDSGAFKDFLAFLYSGRSEIYPENVFNLYRIAHKYDVQELQSDCVLFILKTLSFENLYDSVILGDEFDDEEINIKSREFFIKHFTEIVCTSQWDSFSKKNWRLANNLIKSLAAHMK